MFLVSNEKYGTLSIHAFGINNLLLLVVALARIYSVGESYRSEWLIQEIDKNSLLCCPVFIPQIVGTTWPEFD